MKFVNYVFKARLPAHTVLDLKEIAESIPQSRYYSSKPSQVRIRCGRNGGTTCLIFARGGLRVMGGEVNSVAAAEKIMRNILQKFTCALPVEITLQTITATHSLPCDNINLQKFHKLIKSQLDLEIFCALRIIEFGKVSVNLFSTGKMVLCGCQSVEQTQDIIGKIYNAYDKYINTDN